MKHIIKKIQGYKVHKQNRRVSLNDPYVPEDQAKTDERYIEAQMLRLQCMQEPVKLVESIPEGFISVDEGTHKMRFHEYPDRSKLASWNPIQPMTDGTRETSIEWNNAAYEISVYAKETTPGAFKTCVVCFIERDRNGNPMKIIGDEKRIKKAIAESCYIVTKLK